jgi:hypothetical protein
VIEVARTRAEPSTINVAIATVVSTSITGK